ncbi:MAG: glycosyltransferase family 4 protein [Ignavibacteria bacterium]
MTNTKYKLLFITHSYAMTGGAEDEFERLLKYFSSFPDKYEVHGMFPKGERSLLYSAYCSKFGYYKYGHLPVTYDGIIPYIKYCLKSIIQIFQIVKFAYSEKYDLALINVVVLLWPVIALKILLIKVVVFVREDIYPVWLRHTIYKLFGWLIDYFIPNSDTKLKDIRLTTGKQKCSRIYPAIEEIIDPDLSGLEDKLGKENFNRLITKDVFRFINPARILKKKNQLLILRALNEIKTSSTGKIPQIVFLGYFDPKDEYTGIILDYIDEKELKEHVIFLGEVERKYLYKVYSLINSVVISSLSEGMPLVMVEAFRFGKPFISTKVGGIPEVVTNQVSGILVDFDPTDLSKAMTELMGDSVLYETIKKNAYNIYLRNFKLDQILKNTESVIVDLLNGKN